MKAKVAILGCGNPARRWHLPTLAELSKRGEIDFVALCDMDEQLAEENGRRYGVPHYLSLEEMLDRHKDILVVDVVAGDPTHHVLGRMVAEHGKHVMVEKPMAVTLPCCDVIIDACRRNGVHFEVAENYFRWPKQRLIVRRYRARLLLRAQAPGSFRGERHAQGFDAAHPWIRPNVRHVHGHGRAPDVATAVVCAKRTDADHGDGAQVPFGPAKHPRGLGARDDRLPKRCGRHLRDVTPRRDAKVLSDHGESGGHPGSRPAWTRDPVAPAWRRGVEGHSRGDRAAHHRRRGCAATNHRAHGPGDRLRKPVPGLHHRRPVRRPRCRDHEHRHRGAERRAGGVRHRRDGHGDLRVVSQRHVTRQAAPGRDHHLRTDCARGLSRAIRAPDPLAGALAVSRHDERTRVLLQPFLAYAISSAFLRKSSQSESVSRLGSPICRASTY
ncbi:MAG: Gfo/Idh/MocA family oxidoreductase [Pseudomonadales bacterium]|nr:Gfo/Idh/MocA family oxidoreductase [Pseudomonadales bacterium]